MAFWSGDFDFFQGIVFSTLSILIAERKVIGVLIAGVDSESFHLLWDLGAHLELLLMMVFSVGDTQDRLAGLRRTTLHLTPPPPPSIFTLTHGRPVDTLVIPRQI